MQEWLKAQMANGFEAFRGASIAGSVPVKEELLNELIAGLLAQADKGVATEAGFDPRPFARFIRKATVHAEAGVVTLHVDIRI